ncbi:MAG: hypothetical protein PHW04_03645 [Candidatus Wallbacteria bacterium]|nr:hypothetical protein [Candidatus Wallbacteria bacterium]
MKPVKSSADKPREIAKDKNLEFMQDAVKSIDSVFGEGFAKANPELVGAFLLSCTLNSQLDKIEDKLGDIISELSSLGDISSELSSIESSIENLSPEEA